MTTTAGKTGIEIQVALSPGQRTIGKILSALHLEVLGKAVAKMSRALIAVDGVERNEPLYEAHFIETTPGLHDVEISLVGSVPGPVGPQKALWGKAAQVRVEEGQVTVLLYTPQDGGGATLALHDMRPA